MHSILAKFESHRAGGFTLIELMVTISVAAILLGIAAPNFMEMSIRNRLSNYSNDLISSVNYARSEAVRRGQSVAICRSSNGASCSGSWSDGWIIFVNADEDVPAVVDNDEDVLKVYSSLSTNYTLGAGANFANDITYLRDGSASSTGVITVCYEGETVGSRAIVLTRLRPRMATDTNDDRIPNKDDGSNIASCAAP